MQFVKNPKILNNLSGEENFSVFTLRAETAFSGLFQKNIFVLTLLLNHVMVVIQLITLQLDRE